MHHNTPPPLFPLAPPSNPFIQVVAADGTIFSKGGLITGGLSQGNRDRAEQWRAKDNEQEKQVKQRIAAIAEQLAGLADAQELTEQLQVCAARLSELTTAVQVHSKEVQALEARQKRLQGELQSLRKVWCTCMGSCVDD